MPSHDSEEFGGELYHDIIARLERSWSHWRDALDQVPDDESHSCRVAKHMALETTHDDDEAVEQIRRLLEGDEAAADHDPPGKRTNPNTASLPDVRNDMSRMHDRLLGAIEAASQASDDVLEQVRERIGGTTWIRYEDRATQLGDHLKDERSSP